MKKLRSLPINRLSAFFPPFKMSCPIQIGIETTGWRMSFPRLDCNFDKPVNVGEIYTKLPADNKVFSTASSKISQEAPTINGKQKGCEKKQKVSLNYFQIQGG